LADNPRHNVPTHLDTADGIGDYTVRQLTILIGTSFFVVPAVAMFAPQLGPSLASITTTQWPTLVPPGAVSNVALAAVPLAMAGIAALPFEPPVEHGLANWLQYRARARDLGPDAIQEMIGHPTVDRNVLQVHGEYVAMWELPNVSMRLASDQAREVERSRWARFLDGLRCPVQTTMRATPVDSRDLLEAMRKSPNPNGKLVAEWLGTSRAMGGEIERRRFLSIRAKTQKQLDAWASDVSAALMRANLAGQRLEDDDLADVVQAHWTPRPRKPSRLGPSVMRVESDGIRCDDQWQGTVAQQRWPTTVITDFLESLYDGIASVDVNQIITPLKQVEIRRKLEDQHFKLSTTKQTRKRIVAVRQIDATLSSIEENRERFFDVQIYYTVRTRGARSQLIAQRQEVEQTIEESGGKAADMRWEHHEAAVACAGTLESKLLRRSHVVDTSSLSRAYPWGASELGLHGGVPWGRTLEGNRRVRWTPYARPLIPNPNIAIYATSGGGKGFAAKVATSRMLLAGTLKEAFFLDQAEEHTDGEYGRWARYLGGEVRQLSREHWEQDLAAAVADIPTGTLPPAIVLNVAELDHDARCRAMPVFKRAVFARAADADNRAPRAFGLDEMWTYAGDPEAAREGEDVVRRGRHFLLNGWFMTQRALDALNTSLGQTVQGLCGTRLYGLQNPLELFEVSRKLRWTPEQVEVIGGFGTGEFLLEAGLHRLAFAVDYSPEEFEMANTD
jgi:hypothetical protein